MIDPWTVLGLAPSASDEELRARYVELVKRYSPDRDPEKFAELRDAYAHACDKEARMRETVFGPPALHDLDELIQALGKRTRKTAPLDAWLDVLKEAK